MIIYETIYRNVLVKTSTGLPKVDKYPRHWATCKTTPKLNFIVSNVTTTDQTSYQCKTKNTLKSKQRHKLEN